MRVHLIVAHPEEKSFNCALHQVAKQTLNEFGAIVTESNLYAEQFDAVAGSKDVMGFSEPSGFNLAKAQRYALDNGAFCEQIKQEQKNLIACDLLILQFPLWWWSFPAILKGWIDRVLTSGFAYGQGAILVPKKVMYSITTGGAANQDEMAYYKGKIDGLYQDVFGFMGWKIVPPFIAHGVQQKSHKARQLILQDYQSHLNTILKH
ncbi:NAD(P)H-dependent oxidoreductase [Pseudoalteromonas luteoviolacea]|uniref:NAD(P)H-dependent oxidoreductase n=1 Tax=Pseudoalteromonas luteoviolacea TaxID=43657 RepID=UPI001F2E951A|nr:NAD(P)H-dependent oxidoreductase [Pseudoalteromonas luteoviolacea]MCF6441357.1 NAD(P)H-dependent oxidoreductase [Pseudoalteromonas luteoviolacea]